MMQNKRALVISPFEHWPLSHGSIVRTYFLVKHLAQRNTVFFAYRGGEEQTIPPFVKQGVSNHPNRFLQLLNPVFFFRLWRIVANHKVDVIVVSHSWSCIPGVLLKLFTGKPLWIDAHNVEYIRFRRMGRVTWPLVALLEFAAYRVAERLICVSEIDKSYLISNLRILEEKIYVAPNGADVQKLFERAVNVTAVKHRLTGEPDKPIILFFGSLKHQANAEGVDIILDTIAPGLSRAGVFCNIVIVGLGKESYLRARKVPLPENIRFAGFVDDITAVIKSADLVIVPLTSGGGTRLKILESVACGKRVISTSVGAEGLNRKAFDNQLSICDDWDEFIQQIQNKLNEPDTPTLPSEFAAMYDWNKIFAAI